MARYSKSYEGERRSRSVGIKLTPTERESLATAAKENGAQLSEYVRMLCLRRPATIGTVAGTRRNPDAKGLMRELHAIGNNLNQLTHLANTDKATPQIEELHATTGLVKQAMSRIIAL